MRGAGRISEPFGVFFLNSQGEAAGRNGTGRAVGRPAAEGTWSGTAERGEASAGRCEVRAQLEPPAGPRCPQGKFRGGVRV